MSFGIGLSLLDQALQGDSVDLVRALHRYNLHFFPANVALPTIRNTFSGVTPAANGCAHIIDCIAAGAANKVCEIGEPIASSTSIGINTALTWATHELSCFWDYTDNGVTPTGNAFVGIQLGTMGSNAPFPNAPSSPCLQARINPVTSNWQLYAAVGDGSTPGTLVNSSRGSIDFESKIRLRFIPGVAAELYWWYDKIAEITDPAKLPNFTTLPAARSGLIVSSGSAAWGPRLVTSPLLLMIDTG